MNQITKRKIRQQTDKKLKEEESETAKRMEHFQGKEAVGKKKMTEKNQQIKEVKLRE